MICKGYPEANSKFLMLYDANKRTSYMILRYLDPNDLYGNSMMNIFPNEILEWIDPRGFDLDNYSRTNLDFSVGCFPVDLDCPDELDGLYNVCLLTGEKIKVREKILSKYHLQIVADNNFSLGKKQNTYP